MQEQRKARFGFNTLGNVIPVPNPGGGNVTLIAAMDVKGGIGKDNKMPWHVSEDLQHFKRITDTNTLVMGRSTYESLGRKPLPDRVNIVMTSHVNSVYNHPTDDSVVAMNDLKGFVKDICDREQLFIIGGGKIYQAALEEDLVDDMIITRFSANAECDVFFPEFNRKDWLAPIFSTHQLNGGITMRYEYWRRIKPETIPLKE